MQGARILVADDHEIVRHGLRGLLADVTASLADKTLPQRVRYYSRPELVIIDEFGLDRIERSEGPQGAHLLYKIIAARNQKARPLW